LTQVNGSHKLPPMPKSVRPLDARLAVPSLTVRTLSHVLKLPGTETILQPAPDF